MSYFHIFAMITRISDLPKKVYQRREKINSPLFVIIIESVDDFNVFSNISKIYKIHKYGTIIVFTKEMEQCHNPTGNPFNLAFNARVAVKCHNFPILREWYSIHPNSTVTSDLFLWDSDLSELIALANPNLYERRNSLDGVSLRVAALKVLKLLFSAPMFYGI